VNDEPRNREPATEGARIQTFLIVDVRGYTLFTQQRGDEAAAKLAAKFAGIARETVQTHGGRVVELRGDEALAVFSSARQAIGSSGHRLPRDRGLQAYDPAVQRQGCQLSHSVSPIRSWSLRATCASLPSDLVSTH
jgi:class 3 adenylate cyclase